MQDIAHWLKTLGLPEYARSFAENGMDLGFPNLAVAHSKMSACIARVALRKSGKWFKSAICRLSVQNFFFLPISVHYFRYVG